MERQDRLDELAQQLADGDTGALEPLLVAYHDRLFGFIKRQMPIDLQRVVGPEDVLQETFVDLVKRSRQFRFQGEGSFYNWMATIAKNRLLKMLEAHRAAKRGGGKQVDLVVGEDRSLVELLEFLHTTSETPSRLARRAEALVALRVALAGLPPEMRLAIELKYMHHASPEDIAKQLGKTVGATNVLCHRALGKLREAMGRASSFMSLIR